MVWVIGSNGMLGTELCRMLTERHVAFCGTDRNVDITDSDALASFAASQGAAGKPVTAIVNCAAYTAVDQAESEPALASRLNVDGSRTVARLARRLSVPLVHISTDYVFDGTGSSPYTEDMPVSPLGVYGATKADGEKAVQAETDACYILRTAWLYGWNGKNFVYTMIRAMNARDSVKVVADQRGTPTFAATLSDVIIRILERSRSAERVPYGIYQVTDLGETTWYDFTCEIKKQAAALGLVTNGACAVSPCTTAEYPTSARRPAYSVLSKAKIQAALGITLPEWQESLAAFLRSPHCKTFLDTIK